MSDIKRSCPACDSWTSAVGIAFRDGEPCPYCGLPAEVVPILDAAEKRGLDRTLIERTAQAEVRAVNAEAETERMKAALRRIKDEASGW